jgi:hypothetical protein
VELAATCRSSSSGGLSLAAISAGFTIGYVSNLLGENEIGSSTLRAMFPEDGCLWVDGVGEDGLPAFMRDSIEYLQHHRRQKSCRPRTAVGQTDRTARLRISPHANA